MTNQTPAITTPKQVSTIYNFEDKGRRQFPDKSSEDDALRDFKKRLAIPDNVGLTEDHRNLLLKFILNFHKLISYYQQRRKKENRWHSWFTFLSLFLLVAIPCLIYWVTTLYEQDKIHANIVVSQLTAVLTGLIAVQKSISSWLDKRKIVGNFWKAESELKTNLYTFEDKWKEQAFEILTNATTPTLKESFLIELKAAIADSRAIVQEEQSKFFEAEIYPSIDLGDLLKVSGNTAKEIVTAHATPSPKESSELEQLKKRNQEIEAAKRKVAQLKKEIEQRTILIDDKRKQLADNPAMPKETADAINKSIAAHEEKRMLAEDQLVITVAVI